MIIVASTAARASRDRATLATRIHIRTCVWGRVDWRLAAADSCYSFALSPAARRTATASLCYGAVIRNADWRCLARGGKNPRIPRFSD